MKSVNGCFVISIYTFKELIKSKLLYYVFLLSLFLALITYVATEFTFATPGRVALDVGIGVLSYVSLAISILLGVTLISKEIDQRTVYMVLSRPISRFSFLTGRILGMLLFLVCVHLILGFTTLGIFKFYGGNFESLIHWVFLFGYLESIITLLLVILFSLFVNPVISVVNTIVILIAGHVINDTKLINFVKFHPSLKNFLDSVTYIIPNFNKLNLKDHLLYNKMIPFDYNLNVLLYCICYISFLLLFSSLIFSKKNLD